MLLFYMPRELISLLAMLSAENRRFLLHLDFSPPLRARNALKQKVVSAVTESKTISF